MPLCASTIQRRFTFATVLAGAATLSGIAVGDSVTASAEPKEWDIGAYDNCLVVAADLYGAHKISVNDYDWEVAQCCVTSGGLYHGDGICVAPPAEQAQQAERQPAPPEPGMTLYMPPPVGPVAPPPSEVMQSP